MASWQAAPEEGFHCATCRALRSFEDIYTGQLLHCACLLCIPCVREQATTVLEQRTRNLLTPAKQQKSQPGERIEAICIMDVVLLFNPFWLIQNQHMHMLYS